MEKDKQPNKKNGLKLVEKYDNDDYSRMAGPDYTERPFEIGQEDFERSPHQGKRDIHLRSQGNWHHPGVSGKSDEGETWVNQDHYSVQTNFSGYGPRNYKRSDDRIYEEVCDQLMRDSEVDASNIGVKVENGVVHLLGKVNGRYAKKLAESIIEDLPGVQDVRNELSIFREQGIKNGPEAPTIKDLGIN
jgi:hypothetical protein